jgi:hypothetical protein
LPDNQSFKGGLGRMKGFIWQVPDLPRWRF